MDHEQPERTAPWIWPERRHDKHLTFTDAHLASVRSLLFAWDTAESGAAALAAPADQSIPDGDDEMSLVIDLFLNKARLEIHRGTIRNPFADDALTDEDITLLINGIPDSTTRKLIAGREDISFDASADELALWQEAYRYHGGINPKRPFGSESVSRDVRAIVDPERKLTNAAFSKYRKQLESRLALLLVFFVQHAELAAGDYVCRDAVWFAKDALPADESAEMVSEGEWCNRLLRETYMMHSYCITTYGLLNRLALEGRLSGSFAAMVDQFRLWDLYHEPGTTAYEGSLLDYALAAIRHFPETSGDAEDSLFTLTAARVLNSLARFAEADDLLKRAKLSPQASKKIVTKGTEVTYAVVAALERLIADLGLERIKPADVVDILEGFDENYSEFGWGGYGLVNMLGDINNTFGDVRRDEVDHARAATMQLNIMRGGHHG
jgi:predicted Rdx family selenoprotein